jgi:hypothetical protein
MESIAAYSQQLEPVFGIMSTTSICIFTRFCCFIYLEIFCILVIEVRRGIVDRRKEAEKSKRLGKNRRSGAQGAQYTCMTRMSIQTALNSVGQTGQSSVPEQFGFDRGILCACCRPPAMIGAECAWWHNANMTKRTNIFMSLAAGARSCNRHGHLREDCPRTEDKQL